MSTILTPATVTSILANPKRDTNDDLRINDGDLIGGAAVRGIQLVRLSTSNAALVLDGSATVGLSPTESMALKVKATATAATSANWAPSTLATVSYLGAVDQSKDVNGTWVNQTMVIERTGAATAATATYKGFLFVQDLDADGMPTGTATMTGTTGQTLSLTQLLKLESESGTDFNGDTTIGDAVTSVLASPRADSNEDGKITSADSYTYLSDNGTPDNPDDDTEVTVLTKGAQLVRLASGAVGVDFWGEAAVGSSAGEMPILKFKAAATAATSANWVPSTVAGVSYLGAVDQSKDVNGTWVNQTMVIERTGAATAATATYKGYLFVEDLDADGMPTGTATMTGTTGQTLSLTQLLKFESESGTDFNGDTTIGDAVTSVLGSPRFDSNEDGKITSADSYTYLSDNGTPDNPDDDTEVTVLTKGAQLVRLASGAVGVDLWGEAVVGSSAGEMPILKFKAAATATTSANWAPSTLATVSYLGVVDQSKDVNGTWVNQGMVIERTGAATAATATYKGYLFVEDLDADGMPTGTATMTGTTGQTLSLTQLLKFESESGSDFNGDTTIGDAVTSVLASPRADSNEDGKITSADSYTYLSDNGTPDNPDDDKEVTVLTKGAQLVRLASGAVGIDFWGEAAVGSSAGEMPILKFKAAATAATSANWVPSTLATVSYLGAVDQSKDVNGTWVNQTMVIERTGAATAATATYKGYLFVEDLDADGYPTGTATMTGTTGQTLSLTQLLKFESESGTDFNGDTTIGDAVTSLLASPRADSNEDGKITSADSYTYLSDNGTPENPDDDTEVTVLTKGAQLVRLASGAVGIDFSGEAAVGSSAGEMPILKFKAAATSATSANWAPSTLAGVSYLGAVDQSKDVNGTWVNQTMVIERTGAATAATATYKGYLFVEDLDADGMPTGTATMTGTTGQTLSLTQLLKLESELDLDFNGDGTIGDAVTSVLASPRADWNDDGKISLDDGYKYWSDNGTPDNAGDDKEVPVLIKGAQLVRLTSGAVGIDFSGEAAAGSSAGEMPILKFKAAATAATSANWVPSTLAGVSYLGAVDQSKDVNGTWVNQTMVIERTGAATAATATYKGYLFVEDLDADGYPTGTATMTGTTGQTLSLTQLLKLESQNGVDFNGDNAVGEAVTALLGAGKLDLDGDGKIGTGDALDITKPDGTPGTVAAKGMQLVRLTSGAVAVDLDGMRKVGDSAQGKEVIEVGVSGYNFPGENWDENGQVAAIHHQLVASADGTLTVKVNAVNDPDITDTGDGGDNFAYLLKDANGIVLDFKGSNGGQATIPMRIAGVKAGDVFDLYVHKGWRGDPLTSTTGYTITTTNVDGGGVAQVSVNELGELVVDSDGLSGDITSFTGLEINYVDVPDGYVPTEADFSVENGVFAGVVRRGGTGSPFYTVLAEITDPTVRPTVTGSTVGEDVAPAVALRVKATATAAAANWAPSTLVGVSYLGAVDQSKDVNGTWVNQTMVIERTGAATAATATYKGYLFVEDLDADGYPTGTATMTGTTGQTLSLTQLLKLESQNGMDFNGDNAVGEAVTALLGAGKFDLDGDGKIGTGDVLDITKPDGTPGTMAAKGMQLVRLTSGAVAVDLDGMRQVGDSANGKDIASVSAEISSFRGYELVRVDTTDGYVPTQDDFIIENGIFAGIVQKSGFYGVLAKIEDPAVATTITSNNEKLSFRDYWFPGEDWDAMGNVPAIHHQLVVEADGTVTVKVNAVNDPDITDTGDDGDNFAVLLVDADGNVRTFKGSNGGQATVPMTISGVKAGDLLDLYVYVGEVGDPLTSTSGYTIETSNVQGGGQLSVRIDEAGEVVMEGGSDASEPPALVLQVKAAATAAAANWAPSTVAGVSYLGAVDQSKDVNGTWVNQAMVIERTGAATAATATYKGYLFVENLDAEGNATGTATMTGTTGQTLSLTQVLKLESQNGVDLSGDNTVGDAVTSVLGGARMDVNFDGKITDEDALLTEEGAPALAKGTQLVKLLSGATALDWDGTATTGSSAVDMVVLRSKATATAAAANWVPSTLATVSYVGVVDQSVWNEMAFTGKQMVIERTGSGATSTYKGYMFVIDTDENGMPTGTATMTGTAPQTLSLTQVLALESWEGVDLNGDTTIGDSVLSVLGGSKMDFNRDGLLDGGDVYTIETPDGTVELPAKGIQLVKLASGAAALDWTGVAKTGSSATDMPVLQVKATATAAAANWMPTTVATVSYAGAIASDDGQTLSVIERAGTAASSAAKLWQFTVDYKDDGEAAGTATMIGTVAQTLSASQLLSLESQSGVDLNGDGAITLGKIVEGNDAATRVEGDVGNDMLYGGAGVDTMVGGLGTDLFMFNDIEENYFVPRKATDVINDLSVAEDMLVFDLTGPMAMRVKGNYASAASFAKAADRLLDGKVKAVFGTVGNDGYLAVDDDGEGVTHLIQLVGVKQAPSMLTSETLPDGFGF